MKEECRLAKWNKEQKIASANNSLDQYKWVIRWNIFINCAASCAANLATHVFFPWCRIAISEVSHKEGRHDARPRLRNIFTQEGLVSFIHQWCKETDIPRTKLLVFSSIHHFSKNRAAAFLRRCSQKAPAKRGSCTDTAWTLPGHCLDTSSVAAAASALWILPSLHRIRGVSQASLSAPAILCSRGMEVSQV